MATTTGVGAGAPGSHTGPAVLPHPSSPGALGTVALSALRDGEGHVEDFRVDACSDAACRLLGREPTRLLGRRLGEEYPRDAHDGVLATLRRAVESGEPWRGALRLGGGTGGRLEALAAPVGDVLVLCIAPAAVADDRLAEEAALRRVAVAAAGGPEPAAVVAAAAAEWLALRAHAGVALARRDGGRVSLPHGWIGPRARELGRTRLPTGADLALAAALDAGHPVKVIDAAHPRFPHGLAAPVRVADRPWGALVVAVGRHGAVAEHDTSLLAAAADLVGLALAHHEMREELAAAATTDHLTGLPNRRAFSEGLAGEVRRAVRHGHALSLAVLDLDLFKRVNDTHGHAAGDLVLTEVARRLARERRAGELIARIGGEEFAWILPMCDTRGALAAVERARAAVAGEPIGVSGRLTLSAGVAGLRTGHAADDLFWRADGALYQAKESGRDRTVLAFE